MKSLEAAIDYAHMIVPMIGESDTKEMWRSIEYYLTAHKKIQPVIEKNALRRIEDVIDTIDNSPLTWDELKAMVGKPVWVDEYDPIDAHKGWHRCRWYLVNYVNDMYCYVCDSDGEEYHFDLAEYNKTWSAYRKERE